MDKTILETMQEIIDEDLEIMREVISEDIIPLIKYRAELEKKIADREIKEMYELEEEA